MNNIIKGRKVAHPFYSSGKWLAIRDSYLRSKHYVCELCGQPAKYVHHKNPLKDEDYFVNCLLYTSGFASATASGRHSSMVKR